MEFLEEFGNSKGLGIIKGKVRKFPALNNFEKPLKVPHIGWNTVTPSLQNPEKDNSPLGNLAGENFFYFVHSYFVDPTDKSVQLTNTNYGGKEFTSSVFHRNIFACQFHPEKSGYDGIEVYKKWVTLNKLA